MLNGLLNTEEAKIMNMKLVTRVLGKNLGFNDFKSFIEVGDVTGIVDTYNLMIDHKLAAFNNFTFTSTDYWIFSNQYYFSGYFMQPDMYDRDVIYFAYINLHSKEKDIITKEISSARKKINDILSYSYDKAEQALLQGYQDLNASISFFGYLFAGTVILVIVLVFIYKLISLKYSSI